MSSLEFTAHPTVNEVYTFTLIHCCIDCKEKEDDERVSIDLSADALRVVWLVISRYVRSYAICVSALEVPMLINTKLRYGMYMCSAPEISAIHSVYKLFSGRVAKRGKKAFSLCLALLVSLLTTVSLADDELKYSSGQAVYVPIYSHIYGGPKSRPLNLTATLSIRNTDPSNSIDVLDIDYYNSEGRLVKKYISRSLSLAPMASKRFIVEERGTSGGSGANFIVKWKAKKEVSTPIVQAVHISTGSGQGISFITFGRTTKSPPK